jgi:hypothetical protein
MDLTKDTPTSLTYQNINFLQFKEILRKIQ